MKRGSIFALLLITHNLAAQQVVGRAVREVDGSPLLEALIVMLDDGGHERARAVTTSSGGFDLRAPGQAAIVFGSSESVKAAGRRRPSILPRSRSSEPRSGCPIDPSIWAS